MKKLICTLLSIAVLCAALVFASAEADFIDLSGRWQDPANDRALLRIMRNFEVDAKDDEIWYDVELRWPNAVDSETVWYMFAKYDDKTQGLTYSDGVKADVTYAEDGSIASEEKLWEDSEGALVSADGKLQWTDVREDQLRKDAGEPSLLFERVPRSAPDADEFLSEYFMAVAGVEEGTAGSSLKQAETARDIVRFALRNVLWDADLSAMRRNMFDAWNEMSAEDQNSFDNNFMDIFVPLINSAFGNYSEVAGSFEDAGVGEDMAWLAEDREARESWNTLLGNTLTLGNSDD